MEEINNQLIRLIDLAIALGKARQKVALAEQEKNRIISELDSHKKLIEGLEGIEYPVVVLRDGSTYVISRPNNLLQYAIAGKVIEVEKEGLQ